jgi:hypothetical protein
LPHRAAVGRATIAPALPEHHALLMPDFLGFG